MIDVNTLLNSDNILERLQVEFGDEKRNRLCYWATNGLYPWGVCSSGDLADESPSLSSPISKNIYSIYLHSTLLHGTLGMSPIQIQPALRVQPLRIAVSLDAD